MPVIFGQEIDKKKLLIGGGLVAAAVAVVVWIRARSSAASPDASAPQPADQSGAGMTVGAPTSQVADQYQQQLNNAELQAQTIANRYQENLVTQQQKQYEFQQSQAEQLAPEMLAYQRAELAVDTNYAKRLAATKVSCPGSQALAKDPNGQLYCRQKTSGGFLGIPVGDIFRTISGFVGGVEAAAPTIGYDAAKGAAAYYTGKVFAPNVPVSPKPKNVQFSGFGPVPKSTPPIAPVRQSGHGYEEHYV